MNPPSPSTSAAAPAQYFVLDRALVRRRFAAHAATLASADFLSREISNRMRERLDYIRVEPRHILDLGCGSGTDLQWLAARYPAARLTGVDFAAPLLARARPARSWLNALLSRRPATDFICADAEQLPLPRASMQMVWSNQMLHWLHDPLPALREAQRVLEVDGMLMFSTLGPDTLHELRASLPSAQGERVHRFIDMHDIGDVLVKAGFKDPVMDMERITLTYTELDQLLQEIRAAAAGNASLARPRSLSGKQSWQQARQNYEGLRHDKRLPATFEIIYGHAWKAEPTHTEDGRAVVRFMERKR